MQNRGEPLPEWAVYQLPHPLPRKCRCKTHIHCPNFSARRQNIAAWKLFMGRGNFLYTHIILNNLWLKNLCISLLLGGSHSPDTPEQRWPWGSPQAQRPRASCHAAQKALLLEGKPRNRNLEVNSTESFQAGAVSQGS